MGRRCRRALFDAPPCMCALDTGAWFNRAVPCVYAEVEYLLCRQLLLLFGPFLAQY
eukprot:m.462146 g.462146  ORF g.462146 m.462146 type:complete len:56 (-) comp234827_c0_seq1:27-194(-)